MQYSLCLLAFGSLGPSAKRSLSSLECLNADRLCILGDSAGRNWVADNISESASLKVCWHSPNAEALQLLDLDFHESASYSKFGEDRFINLTTFKWDLLSQSLILHPDTSFALFTDLDVYWARDPKELMFQLFSDPHTFVIAQDDSPGKHDVHYCSGVMIWKNDERSIQSVSRMFNTQLQLNAKGKRVPDEPIFNRWAKEQEEGKVKSLEKHQFVIGHRFFHVILGIGFKVKDVYCYHANYVTGEEAKNSRLSIFSRRLNGDLSWLPPFIREIMNRLFDAKK